LEEKETNPSGLLFSKSFIRFSAIFLGVLLLLVAFLHWKKGDYRLENQPAKPNVEQSQ